MSSETPTVEQSNKAIALFDDWKDDFCGYMSIGKQRDPTIFLYTAYKPAEMKYHTSWDWLMPIWKRLTERVAALTEEGDYPADFCTIMDVYAYHCEQVDIAAAHDIVYKGIQWYNQNKPNEQ
jgi:hypothetical protein